ncbi:hypothetical protein HanHA89_Chr11g0411851 [Helianthus annuus]|nr:hypothetical protein HanHA89_Chr11g0411851 [Helianthus annuus]
MDVRIKVLLSIKLLQMHRREIVIATKYASGFDNFFIAPEAQFKYNRSMALLTQRRRDQLCAVSFLYDL